MVFGEENYKNNFGELEAKDTDKRRTLDFQERMKKPPISSKENVVNHNNKWYPFNKEGEYAQVSQKNNNQYLENANNGRKLGRNSTEQRQELDNSSFSMPNDTWQEHLEKNYKEAPGVKTYFKDILLPMQQDLETSTVNLPKRNDITTREIKLSQNRKMDPFESFALENDNAIESIDLENNSESKQENNHKIDIPKDPTKASSYEDVPISK